MRLAPTNRISTNTPIYNNLERNNPNSDGHLRCTELGAFCCIWGQLEADSGTTETQSGAGSRTRDVQVS